MSQFLADQLSADEQEAFENHLESCGGCRNQFNAVVAPPELWGELRRTLGSGASLRAEEICTSPSVEMSAVADVADASLSHDAMLSLLKPTDHPNMLGRFGGYEIAGVIGSGGMGVVFKGLDLSLNRFVAIKVLSPHFAASGAARKRFSREGQAAAAVVHDNVVAIHSVAEDNGRPKTSILRMGLD